MICRFAVMLVFLATTGAAYAAETEMDLQPDQNLSGHAAHTPASTKPLSQKTGASFFGSNAVKSESPSPVKKPGGDQQSKTGPEVYNEIDLPETTPDDTSGGQTVMPIITQKAIMSRSDENWIVCNEPIKTVLAGDDAHIDVKYFGSNAFIKFQYLSDGQKTMYPAPKPTPLHIPCGDAIYSLIVVPMKVPSQTIRLGSGKTAKIRENATIFREQDTRKKVQELIRRAYNDDLPDSFTVKLIDKPLDLFRDVAVRFHRTITVDGEGLVLKEYYLTPSVDGLELSVRQFIRKEISPLPSPMSVIPPRPAKGERARLFVVEFQAMTDVKDVKGGRDVQ